nr:MAG TPA: hypothetical protein [Caudoviricetes sp.]
MGIGKRQNTSLSVKVQTALGLTKIYIVCDCPVCGKGAMECENRCMGNTKVVDK